MYMFGRSSLHIKGSTSILNNCAEADGGKRVWARMIMVKHLAQAHGGKPDLGTGAIVL